jgi:hypothetical protein
VEDMNNCLPLEKALANKNGKLQFIKKILHWLIDITLYIILTLIPSASKPLSKMKYEISKTSTFTVLHLMTKRAQ